MLQLHCNYKCVFKIFVVLHRDPLTFLLLVLGVNRCNFNSHVHFSKLKTNFEFCYCSVMAFVSVFCFDVIYLITSMKALDCVDKTRADKL